MLRMLDVLLGSETSVAEKRKILENEYHIQMTQKLKSEVSGMCNLSKGVLEKGMAKGLEQGRAEGIISSIQNLVKNMGVSIEQAMAVLEVPEAERQNYRELLKPQ